jgi:hypothetical protein
VPSELLGVAQLVQPLLIGADLGGRCGFVC